MSKKGLIFSIQQPEGPALYQAVPWIVGIYEFQVNNLTEGYIKVLYNYWRTIKPRSRPETLPQLRVIPVGQSVSVQREILPYERVDELTKTHDRLAVAPCICRRLAKKSGEGCDAPEETCLVFGEFADYYIQNGLGRPIDRAELNEILARADAANLVLQPSNSRNSLFICCCCGCCCGILGGLKRYPKPAEAVTSSFIAQFEPDLCIGCLVCLERCQMNALKEAGDIVRLNFDRCIGCGLCVSTCPTGALTLLRKPESEQKQVPATMDETWRMIMQAQSGSED
jgi:ferredoxin